MIHGGHIQHASEEYGIAIERWLDLSTGISPIAYPFSALDRAAYQALPYPSAEFLQAAADYYGTDQLLPIAGSQAAIQQLPHILPRASVLLPEVGYQEHAHHWRRVEGVSIDLYPSQPTQPASASNPSFAQAAAARAITRKLDQNPERHLVVINPNNPTTLMFDAPQLLEWAERLAEGCYLIVDEAFMEATPEQSLLKHLNKPVNNIIVLRSFGKFFGLAGLRLGFIVAQPLLLKKMRDCFGPWAVNGPAQQIATQAFRDLDWHKRARQALAVLSDKNQALWQPLFQMSVQKSAAVEPWHHPLFSTYRLPCNVAERLYDHFCRLGILLRLIPEGGDKTHALLRIGLADVLSDAASEHRERIEHAIRAAHDITHTCAETEFTVGNSG